MYSNIRGISLKGALFTANTAIRFYSKESERMSIIFGKNGSGKSTLSRAFSNCDGAINEFGITSNFIDENNAIVSYTETHAESTFVFNEDYIHKNVRVQEKGLSTIVMLGKQVDLEEKISKAEIAVKKATEDHKKVEEEAVKFDGDSLVTAPLYHRKQIKARLQGDDSWAGIDCNIKGNRQNTAVTEGVVDEICGITPSRPRDELKCEFDEMMKTYSQVRGGAAKIANSITQIGDLIDEDKLIEALAKVIEKPDLTDREKYILDAVVGGKQVYYEGVSKHFEDEIVEICPYCLQSVTSDYKSELTASIHKVLSKIVDQHKSELKALKLNRISFDKDICSVLNKELVDKCELLVNGVNGDIELYNSLLEQKYDNVYTPVCRDRLGTLEKIKIANASLQELEILREAHNNAVTQKNGILNSLIKINKELYRFAIEESLNQYNLLKKQQYEIKAKLVTVATEKNKSIDELNQLLQLKKNTKIAIDHINKGLQYVFFSPNRLELRAEDDEYRLYSNGSPVKPSDVSCGERNIIALCYFFTQMMDNLEETNMYTRESLVVIDDPVSSFDFENRIGILSYLKSQVLRIMLGNKQSKLILFTHDLSTLFDSEKMVEEIKNACEKKHGKKSTDYHLYELKNKVLIDFMYKKRNEYTLLIESIFRYGAEETNEDELVIGNVMRRALEAFSTFEYKRGIDSISCDQEILSSLGDVKYSIYFENLMYRLVLNGESHTEERVRNLHDQHFFSTTSETEKIRTAKDVLCLLRLLNRQHIEAHLCGIPNATLKIDGWCQNILTS